MTSVENTVFILLIVLCFILLVKWTTARTFRYSPALLFFVLFVLQQAIGSMLLATPAHPHTALARLGLQLGTIGFTLGVGAATILSRFRPGQELIRTRGRMCFSGPDVGTKVGVLIVGYLMATLIMLFYFYTSGGIPLFEGIHAMLSGDEALAAQQLLKQRRMELTYFETSSYRGQGYVDQIRMVVLPFIFGCLLLFALGTRKKSRLLLVLPAALPVVIFLAGTGQRHPTLAFLMAMSILGYAISRPEAHKRLLVAFGLVGVSIFFALTFLLGRYTHTDSLGSDLMMVPIGLWNRIVYSNAFGTIAVFDLFPNPEPYRYGMTWIHDLVGFLPGPHVAFSAWLFRRLYGFVGTASPMSFAEMYANFGLAGVFFGAAVLGLFMQGLQVWWARRRVMRAEHMLIYSILSMACARWAMGGLLAPLQYGFLSIPLLVLCIRFGETAVHVLQSALRQEVRSPRGGSGRPLEMRPRTVCQVP